MPVLIPIIAAGAAYFAAGAVVTAIAVTGITAVVVGVVVGAVVGAAVGAIGAAVTGGDIGEGALWGAVGGAVAGGFAGFAAGAANTANASNAANASLASDSTKLAAAEKGLSSGSSSSLLSGVSDTAQGALVTSAGDMISGYAQGEAAGGIAAEDRAAAEKARQDNFLDQMDMISANHSNSMESIREQADNTLALADKNNAAAMDQLNTRIGADKDAAKATIADREAEQSQFNDSIMGTDANLFDRPTFNFNPAEDTAAFDSGFDEAAALSPNTQPTLTPEEQFALDQATA